MLRFLTSSTLDEDYADTHGSTSRSCSKATSDIHHVVDNRHDTLIEAKSFLKVDMNAGKTTMFRLKVIESTFGL